MMNTLTTEVQAAIASNLPALAADELKKFITKAQEDAAARLRAEDHNARLEKRVKELDDKLGQHEDLDRKLAELSVRERAVQDQQVQLRMDTAMNRALVAEAELKGVKETVSQVFRNTEFRNTTMRDVAVPVAGQPGGNGSYGTPGMVLNAKEQENITQTTA